MKLVWQAERYKGSGEGYEFDFSVITKYKEDTLNTNLLVKKLTIFGHVFKSNSGRDVNPEYFSYKLNGDICTNCWRYEEIIKKLDKQNKAVAKTKNIKPFTTLMLSPECGGELIMLDKISFEYLDSSKETRGYITMENVIFGDYTLTVIISNRLSNNKDGFMLS